MDEDEYARRIAALPDGEMTVEAWPLSPAAVCSAEPCVVCGACKQCRDFHTFTGRGCTTDNCPRSPD